MFRHYIKVALVNFTRRKAISFINVLGLAVGMACFLLIMGYVVQELSFDRFHENADRIYRLRTDLKISGEHLDIPKSSPPMAESFMNNFPEVQDAVRVRPIGRIPVRFEGTLRFEDRVLFADNSVFTVFSFPMLKGDFQTPLNTAYSVVVTESMAAKYFGDKDPIGKVLNINDEHDFTVTGVMKNVPGNSHLMFDMLCSFETYAQNFRRDMRNWLSINNYTYVLLKPDTDIEQLEHLFPELINLHAGNMLKYVKGDMVVSLQPLTSIHLHSNLMQEISPNGNIVNVTIFIIIAIFILAIACINFMNLSTARSGSRSLEVGVRKVLGAGRVNIIQQFILEAVLYSLVSMSAAFLLVEMALPFFRSIAGTTFNPFFSMTPWIIPGLIATAVIIGLIAGSYPALFLSTFQPVRGLKGLYMSGKSGSRFRNLLVIFQFSISVALIIGTMVVMKQLDYLKNSTLGFQKEQLVVVPISDESTLESLRPLKEELSQYGSILGVAASSHVPGQITYVNPFIPEGFSREQMQYMGELNVDHDFIPTLGIELAEGRNFSPLLSTDIKQSVIVNEAAVRKFGWDQPIGKTIEDISMSGRASKYTVIGVVKDFHVESLHKRIEPLFISYTSDALNLLAVRIRPENIPETISFLESKMSKMNPGRPFEYEFLDDVFDAQYRSEENLSRIVSSFSGLAIFIACLGLFGLASFSTERRIKEIGIRKILGSSTIKIAAVLSGELTRCVLIANVVAWPAAYFFLNKWLQGFAFRTRLPLSVFVMAAVISLSIALVTISLKTVRAALADPVNSLRYE